MTHAAPLAEPVPHELKSDFLGKLHYASEDMAGFALDADGACVRFDVKPGREAQVGLIAARIAEVAAKVCDGRRDYEPRVLADHRRPVYAHRDDPGSALIDAGELIKFGPGRFGIGPRLVALEAYFEEGLLNVADRLGAVRHRYPSIIGVEALQRCRYIQAFPHALTLCSHLREDLEAIRSFAAAVDPAAAALEHPAEQLAPAECVLAPTVCFHHYAHLRDRNLDEPHTITAVGHCFRYEAGAMASLERLWDFTMREVVFVGPEDYVIERRDRCIELASELLEEWGIGYELKTATDPFFIEGYSGMAAYQQAFELKYEVRADLPYVPGKSLAIGSFNFHQDFFGRSLGITGAGADGAVCTGCVGFGLERVLWAFLAQHGPEPEGWPAPARQAVETARSLAAA